MRFSDNLINEIKNTESQSDIKEGISDNIIESKKILQYFRKEYGESSKKYKEILKEYNDLRQQIEKSIQSDNKVTTLELNSLQKEYNDIKELESYLDYIDRKTNQSIKEIGKLGLNKISNIILSDSNEDLLENIDSINFFLNIPDEKLRKIKTLLNETPDGNDPTTRLEVSNIMYEHVVSIPGLKSVFNTAQDKLINKIMGNEDFNEEYIKGYDSSSVGNFIFKVEHINLYLEKIDINTINQELLVNIFGYLTTNGRKLDSGSLISLFGKGKLFKLGKSWEKGKNILIKNVLIDNGLGNIITMIEMFSSPKVFLKNIGNLNKEEQKIAIQFLEQNIQSIKNKFREELNTELKEHNPNIPDKQIKQSIDELLNHLSEIYENEGISFDKKVKHIYLQFGKLNKEYNNCINIQKYTNDLNELKEKEKQKEIVQNQIAQSQTNNIEELAILKEEEKLLKSQSKERQTITTINNLTDNDIISKIISGEIDYDEYIAELRVQNKELDKQIKEVEKEKFEHRNKEEQRKTIEKLNTIDSKLYLNNSYYIEKIPEQNGENNTLIINGKEITGITGKEYNSIIETNSKGEKIIKNSEALKNLIDFKEKMKLLNLDFVWTYRNELTIEAKKHPEYSSINNTDTDLLNPKELHKLLNFVLTLIGGKGDTTSISGTYAKIIQINGGGMLNNKTNFDTKFGNIGQKFYELGYIGKNSFDTKNKSNIINYKNILKQQKN